MKSHWWSCVLGLLCMPAGVILNTWTVSQNPSSISHMRVNSSAEITCSTSLPDALGLYLHRQFHGKRNIVYLALNKGEVTKSTMSDEFAGRIHITPDKDVMKGYGFKLRLSLLGLDDTDLYYCQWSHFLPQIAVQQSLSSNGTIIIVRDYDPQEQCENKFNIMIFLSVTAFIVIVFITIGILIFKCGRFKKHTFRPNRSVPPIPNRPEYLNSPQSLHQPYMTTLENTFDYRGIL